MTEVNGLRLAYRGLVTGLAAGYVWTAIAMIGSLLIGSGALVPLRLLGGGSGRDELLIGIGVAAVASGLTGMAFAYFFGRFFTVRSTLLVAGPCFAVLAWLLTSQVGHPRALGLELALGAASLAYGLMLGAGLPTRGEVTRYSAGSPST